MLLLRAQVPLYLKVHKCVLQYEGSHLSWTGYLQRHRDFVQVPMFWSRDSADPPRWADSFAYNAEQLSQTTWQEARYLARFCEIQYLNRKEAYFWRYVHRWRRYSTTSPNISGRVFLRRTSISLTLEQTRFHIVTTYMHPLIQYLSWVTVPTNGVYLLVYTFACAGEAVVPETNSWLTVLSLTSQCVHGVPAMTEQYRGVIFISWLIIMFWWCVFVAMKQIKKGVTFLSVPDFECLTGAGSHWKLNAATDYSYYSFHTFFLYFGNSFRQPISNDSLPSFNGFAGLFAIILGMN